MSLAALKRKSQRYTNHISGKDANGFSIVGGLRNVGSVGPTNLAKSVTRTRFRGAAPMGNGGCCGNYVISVSNSGSCCVNDPTIIKSSVKNTHGMIDTKYKWMSGTYPNWWVQDTSTENYTQSAYIEKQKITASARCGVITSTDAGSATSNQPNMFWENGIPRCSKQYTKDPKVAVSSGEYTTTGYLKSRCLPAPASKQPFPFIVNNRDNCHTSYTTWQEAQQAGLLPANYVG
jgi:hypothetical protein